MKSIKLLKLIAVLTLVCFALPVILPAQAVSAYTFSKQLDSFEDNFTLDICSVKLSVEQISETHYMISYTTQNGENIQYEVNIDKKGEAVILLNGVETFRVPTTQPISSSQLGDMDTTKGSHYLWDGIWYVPAGQYIKYPHPDRDLYGISPFSTWSATGYLCYHNQMDQATSGVVASGGPGVIGAVIGAIIGAIIGGAVGAVVGAILTAVFGVILGAIGGVTFLDEWGCLWWMLGKSFLQWAYYNAEYIFLLYMLSPLLAHNIVMTQFWSNGYLRVGSATFYDAIGAGSP